MTQSKVSSPAGTDHRPRHDTAADSKRLRRANFWIIAMALVVAAFLIYQLPPYAALDPTHARRPLKTVQYWLLVGHVTFGTVALVTMCLQLWPWLRQRHPEVHRWSGRVFVFGGALPAAFFAISVFPYIPSAGSIGVVTSALLWSYASLVGMRRARQRRYADHRRWMLYSFAIVWGQVIWGFAFGELWMHFAPWKVNFGYIVETVRWVGWVANLVVVQWWLERSSGRPFKLPTWERQPAARG